MASAFVPVFTETREKSGMERMWLLAKRMFSSLSLVLGILVLIGILLSTFLLLAFPDKEFLSLVLILLRIMLPYAFFICLAAFFSAMLNALHFFMLPAAVPVILNLSIIATVLIVCPGLNGSGRAGIMAVAWAVILAGIIQLSTLLIRLLKEGFRPRFVFDWRDAGLMKVWRLMGVAFIGVGVTQVNVLLDRFIAAFISRGSPSYLYFSERLIYFPLGIFATALGTVLLPAFSGHAASSRIDKMLETFNQSIRHLIFLMLPASAGMMALAGPIIRLVYERGDFTVFSTRMTMLALMCYAPGLIMFGMLKVLVPLFYARQDMKTPVRVGLICTGLNIVLSLILMWPFKHIGIALATVLAATAHVVILAWLAHRKIGSPGWCGIARAFARMACAVVLMTATAVFAQNLLYEAVEGLGLLSRQVVALGGSIGLAVLVYLAGAMLFRCPELGEIWRAINPGIGVDRNRPG